MLLWHRSKRNTKLDLREINYVLILNNIPIIKKIYIKLFYIKLYKIWVQYRQLDCLKNAKNKSYNKIKSEITKNKRLITIYKNSNLKFRESQNSTKVAFYTLLQVKI